MRTFNIKGPFGLQFTLATSVPGIVSITYPSRAQSEPLVKAKPEENATELAPSTYSEISIDVPMTYDVAVSFLISHPYILLHILS